MHTKDHYSHEAIFLAHISALERVRNLKKTYIAYDVDDMEEFLEYDYRAIQAFKDPQTVIGREIEALSEDWKVVF